MDYTLATFPKILLLYVICVCCPIFSAKLFSFIHRLFSFTVEVCPPLSISNGSITYGPDMTADFDVGTIATYTCNDGYRLSGFETRECVLGGRWNRLPPVCIGTLGSEKVNFIKCMHVPSVHEM